MANFLELDQLRKLNWGHHIARATATLPQTTHAPIFTIAGGRVLITFLLGQITTVLGTVGNMKLIAEPTVGNATDMCAVVAAGTLAAGRFVTITGKPGDAMLAQVGAAPGFAYQGLVVDTGTIDLSLSASDTGAIKWDVFYVPLDTGATLVAA